MYYVLIATLWTVSLSELPEKNKEQAGHDEKIQIWRD